MICIISSASRSSDRPTEFTRSQKSPVSGRRSGRRISEWTAGLCFGALLWRAPPQVAQTFAPDAKRRPHFAQYISLFQSPRISAIISRKSHPRKSGGRVKTALTTRLASIQRLQAWVLSERNRLSTTVRGESYRRGPEQRL